MKKQAYEQKAPRPYYRRKFWEYARESTAVDGRTFPKKAARRAAWRLLLLPPNSSPSRIQWHRACAGGQ